MTTNESTTTVTTIHTGIEHIALTRLVPPKDQCPQARPQQRHQRTGRQRRGARADPEPDRGEGQEGRVRGHGRKPPSRRPQASGQGWHHSNDTEIPCVVRMVDENQTN